MSLNQPRSDKNDSHFRKPGGGGRSTAGSGAQQRTFTGGPGRGGAPPNTAPNLSTNRSFKKNNAQGGQSRGAVGPVNPSDPNAASSARFAQSSGHVQSTLHGVSNIPAQATISKPTDASSQNNNRPLPKAPPSQTTPVISNSNLPSTPEKGDGAKAFPLQFGSLSPGFIGMQVPPRTSSAPPNLDEQKRDQARRDAPRTIPSIPLPSAPKPEAPKKNIALTQRPVIQETHTEMKTKRDMQVPSVSPPTQSQKPSAIPMAGISMPLPYYQPPTHFTGPNSQIQSQGMQSSPLQMAMPMPLHMGSPSQVPQQVYLPGYPHLIQTQGFTDFTHQVQNQNFGFNHQMGSHLTHQHQLGTVGISSPPQFNQQQAGNAISNRKTVKITHPDTHEELRLDSKDNVLTGSRPYHNSPPQSQALPNFISTRPIGPPAFPVHNSVSLSSAQSTAGSQVPRSNYSVSQASPISVNKKEAPVQGKPGSFILDNNVRDVQEKVPPTRPTSTRVTIKAAGFTGDKVTNSNTILEAKPQESLNSVVNTGVAKKDSELKAGSSLAAPASVVTSALGTTSTSPIGSPRISAYFPSHVDAIKSTSDGNIQKQLGKTGDFQQSPQDSGNSSAVVVSELVGASMGFTSSVLSEGVSEAVQLPTISVAKPSDVSCGDRGREGSYLSESSELRSVVKPVEDHYAKQRDLYLQEKTTVSDEGEKKLPGVVQSDIPLKAMDDVRKTEGGEIQKVDYVAVVKGASPTAVEAPSCSEGDNASSTDSKECVVSDSSSLVGITGGARSKEYEGDSACVFDVEATSISANVLEADVGQMDPIQNTRPSSSSGTDSGLIKTKNNKAKKRKEMLQKADAIGTTDLYMAYKGSEEKKEVVASEITSERNSEEVSANVKKEASTGHEDDQSKCELDNWEDAADIATPKLRLPGKGEEGVTVKKYSRDFMLTFSEQCTILPVGFEITSDISNALMSNNGSASHGDHEIPSPGKISDRPTGAARHDRRGNGTVDTDNRWNKVQGPYPSGRDSAVDLGHGSNVTGFRTGPGPSHGVLRNPRAHGPGQHVGGILSGPMHSSGFQGMQRNYSDADRWQRATNYNQGLMPAPKTPLQVMHKAEKKYEVGKISDEEQAKQRKLKSILNRLTPQNFEKLFEQVKEVNIDNVVTLAGVISQIFDKALMEPTFCEMYANFYSHLATELPDLSIDDEKITFRRLLLNKCQEEFERGEREEQEANEADGEGEIKQSEQEREEKRLKVRRRMLGNIRLIGELYKKRMLTERIMHECINKLLGDYNSPDEENIEALCKLMSTIGEMIDHPKAKGFMDAYFDIMRQLSNNMSLSSRVRFMLRDAIDLRKNKWQQRRKVEGPKKIDEVHRDAVQERLGQSARLSRGPSMNTATRRGQPVEFSPRGPMLSTPVGQGGSFRGTPQVRGYAMQDARTDDRSAYESRTLSVPLLQRSGNDQPITLGPQGGLARGMAFRGQPSVSSSPLLDTSASYGDPRRTAGGPNGYSATLDRGAYSSREDHFARHSSERFGGAGASDQSNSQEHNANRDLRNPTQKADESMPTTPFAGRAGGSPAQNLSSETVWPEERLREKSIAAIKEYYSAKDEKEIALCMNELNAPSFYPVVVSTWVSDSFERKDKERDSLAQLLVNLTKPQEGLFTPAQLIEGFQSVLSNLEDTVNDAPRAAEFLGRIFGSIVVENIITLKEVGRLIHEVCEELGSLLQVGLAGDVLGNTLEMIKLEKGESTMNEIHAASNLKLEDFRPPGPIRSRKLEMFIKG